MHFDSDPFIYLCGKRGRGGGGVGAKTQILALYWSFSSDGAANVSVKGLMLLGRRPQLEATHPPLLISKQTYTKERKRRKKEREERKEREEEKEEEKNTRSA